MAFKWSGAATARTGVRVVLVEDGRLRAGPSLPAEERREAEAWIGATRYRGAAGTVAWPQLTGPSVLLVGIGARKEAHAARWRRSWAAAGRALVKAAVPCASFEWPADMPGATEIVALAALAAEGLAQGLYTFDAYRSEQKATSLVFQWIGPELSAPAVRQAVRRAETISSTLNEVRDLANRPANDLGPMELAAAARRLARGAGLSCKVWDVPALKKMRCHALLAVAQGSRRPGCLIRLAYAGRRGARQRPLAVIGKAVTFDTGGISLKPPKGMEWMKYDKCGGLTALAAVLLAARLKLPRPLVAYIPAVENMPGGGATRPGDIVRARNGKSIEILNTDAEGRLILADALCIAAEEKPAAMVDLATLTGAAIVALGHEASALLSNDDRLALELMLSGETTGERLWQLPLWPEYDQMLQGAFADIQNIGDGSAGTIAGGAFLKQFVPEGMPWAHLDIAGTAWLETEKPYGAPGATLATARLLADWAERHRDDA